MKKTPGVSGRYTFDELDSMRAAATPVDPLAADIQRLRAAPTPSLNVHESMLISADDDCREKEAAINQWSAENTRARVDAYSAVPQEGDGVSNCRYYAERDGEKLRQLVAGLSESERRRTFVWLAYVDTLDAEDRRSRSRSVCPECGSVFVPAKRGQIYDKRECSTRAGSRRRYQQQRSAAALSLFDRQTKSDLDK